MITFGADDNNKAGAAIDGFIVKTTRKLMKVVNLAG